MAPSTPPRPLRARSLAALVVVLVAGAPLLTACDIREETPPPAPLVADAAEMLRDRSALQAAGLADAAREAAATADQPVAAILTELASASDAHAEELGGVYDPFPGITPSPTPTPTDAPSPPPPATAASVAVLLHQAADAARADAAAVDDARMAHLLTAITLSRTLLAERLDVAMGATAATPAEVTVPGALPEGMDPQAAVVLVQSEDAAGMAWEVLAARSADDARPGATARATLHRQRAQAWAEAAGIAGTGTDPRRSAYDLPDAVTAADATPETMLPALGVVEATLGADYAALVPTVAGDARDGLLDAALEALREAASLGVVTPVLPGYAAAG